MPENETPNSFGTTDKPGARGIPPKDDKPVPTEPEKKDKE